MLFKNYKNEAANSDKNTPLYFALVRIIQGNDREIAQENIKNTSGGTAITLFGQ